MTRSTYLADSRRVLHDPNGDIWTDATLNAFINEVVPKRDRICQCVRSLQTVSTVAGTESYAFSGFSNTRIFDVVNVNILSNGVRNILQRMSFSKMNARVRYLSPSWRGLPMAWALYQPSTIYVAPSPDAVYTLEADCLVYSAELTADASDDSVNYPFTEPVKYGVAWLAKLNERRYEQADAFLAQFEEACRQVTQTGRGIVPSPYATI